MIVCILRLSQTSNATQTNKPGKYVAFEEFGGFENIGKDLGNFPFAGMNVGT